MSRTHPNFTQRTVLGLLLERHPELMTLGEIQAALPDLDDVVEAVVRLVSDGLATRLGDNIGASWTVVRYEALGVV
jgi:hypothetical protein